MLDALSTDAHIRWSKLSKGRLDIMAGFRQTLEIIGRSVTGMIQDFNAMFSMIEDCNPMFAIALLRFVGLGQGS